MDKKQEDAYRLLIAPDVTRVEVKTPDGKTVWADFKTMTLSDQWMLESLTRKDEEIGGGRTDVTYDYEERKRLIYRFMLKAWNIDCKLEHESCGWLTEECWKRVLRLHGTLLENLVSKYQDTLYVSQEEEELLIKQCSILFSKNSRGVKNAHEAISLFCTLGSFWEKFGINRFDLARLPYREYIMLRMVLGHDMERTRAAHTPKKSPTRIAGAGGKTRPSRGIVIDDGE